MKTPRASGEERASSSCERCRGYFFYVHNAQPSGGQGLIYSPEASQQPLVHLHLDAHVYFGGGPNSQWGIGSLVDHLKDFEFTAQEILDSDWLFRRKEGRTCIFLN
jgi:hypothetical protein